MKSFSGYMGLVSAATVLACAAGASAQTRFALWDFNDSNTTIDQGTGTLTLVGGTVVAPTGAFPSQSGSTDPNPGVAYSTSGYPLNSTLPGSNGTAGIEFAVPTTGYNNIQFVFDTRFSNSASNFTQIQYSTNGTSFQVLPGSAALEITGTNFITRTIDLTGVAGVDNNPNFKVRVVTVAGPSNLYEPNTGTSTYGGGATSTSGTIRYDYVQFIGDAFISLPPAGNGSAEPDAVCVGSPTLLTVAVTPGQNPASTSVTVSVNASALGGSSTFLLNDQNLNGDLFFGDGVYSAEITPTIATAGVAILPVTLTDNLNRVGNTTIAVGSGACDASAGSSLVVSQIYGGGDTISAVFNADFVEIFNRGASAVVLEGKSVQYGAASGASGFFGAALLSGTLQPGQYYLVQMSQPGVNSLGDPLDGANTPDAVASGSIGMSQSTGKVAIVDDVVALGNVCVDSRILDLVGYGDASTCFEGAGNTLDNVAGGALFRLLGGCQDSNQNFNDFELLAPEPRNTADVFNVCVTGPTCDSTDFDGDGDEATDQDIEAFFSVIGGGACPTGTCGDIDFDNDGDEGTDADIEAFFRVIGGGACTL